MRMEHKKWRSKKTGRVRRKTMSWHYGHMDFWNRTYVPQRQFNKYVKQEQGNVATLKAGFVPAFDYYKSASKIPVSGTLPAFVKKQAKKLGTKQDNMSKRGNGDLVSINKVPYASTNPYMDKWVAFTQRVRQKDIQHGMAKRISKQIEKFNKAS